MFLSFSVLDNFFCFKFFCFFCILGPPYCGIGATIRIGREIRCLPYAGFFLDSKPRPFNSKTNLRRKKKKKKSEFFFAEEATKVNTLKPFLAAKGPHYIKKLNAIEIFPKKAFLCHIDFIETGLKLFLCLINCPPGSC